MAKKVLKRDVDRAAAELQSAMSTWGPYNMVTQRAEFKYNDLKEAWERQTGKPYAKKFGNPLPNEHAFAVYDLQAKEPLGGNTPASRFVFWAVGVPREELLQQALESQQLVEEAGYHTGPIEVREVVDVDKQPWQWRRIGPAPQRRSNPSAANPSPKTQEVFYAIVEDAMAGRDIVPAYYQPRRGRANHVTAAIRMAKKAGLIEVKYQSEAGTPVYQAGPRLRSAGTAVNPPAYMKYKGDLHPIEGTAAERYSQRIERNGDLVVEEAEEAFTTSSFYFTVRRVSDGERFALRISNHSPTGRVSGWRAVSKGYQANAKPTESSLARAIKHMRTYRAGKASNPHFPSRAGTAVNPADPRVLQTDTAIERNLEAAIDAIQSMDRRELFRLQESLYAPGHARVMAGLWSSALTIPDEVEREQWFREALTGTSFGKGALSKSNPHFPGRKGTGQRFDECVEEMSDREGVYDPEGLCAYIGREKYGKRGMQKLARRGRKSNPGKARLKDYGDQTQAIIRTYRAAAKSGKPKYMMPTGLGWRAGETASRIPYSTPYWKVEPDGTVYKGVKGHGEDALPDVTRQLLEIDGAPKGKRNPMRRRRSSNPNFPSPPPSIAGWKFYANAPTKALANETARRFRSSTGQSAKVVKHQDHYYVYGRDYSRRPNPAGALKRMPKSKAKKDRWGVYVSDNLAYVSTKKLDANKAATKLRADGRVNIDIRPVEPNPVSGKVPKVGWRPQYKKAAYVTTQTPRKRRKEVRTARAIRSGLRKGSRANPRLRYPTVVSDGRTNVYAYRVSFTVNGKPHKWVRYHKGIYAAVDAAKKDIAREWPGAKIGKLSVEASAAAQMANPRGKATRATRRANPIAKATRKKSNSKANPKGKSSGKSRRGYVVKSGDAVAWAGRLKKDANKAMMKLQDAGKSAVQGFEAEFPPKFKMGWRKQFSNVSRMRL